MIVPMKKITVLCMDKDREQTIDQLRRIGVLHVVPVREAESGDLSAARRDLEKATHARDVLTAFAHHHHGTVPPGFSAPSSAAEVIELVDHIERRQHELAAEADALRMEERRIEPFGHFSPALIQRLNNAGINVKLCTIPRKHALTVPDGVMTLELSQDAANRYIAYVGCGEISIDAEGLPMPRHSLNEIRRALGDNQKALQNIEGELVLLARQQHLVDERAKALQQHVHRLTARDGMGASGSIVYLDGFCPVDRVDTLSEAAGQSGWGILVRDPEAGDTVPTLIRNPTWVRPIKAVFDMIEIMPGYHEADISAVFLFFFSVFFAMLIGDAGYGLLFLLLTLFARRKLPKAPAYPFHLFGILSVCTMAWGVLTGNAFGIVALPGILQGLRVTWLLEQNNVMKLCFFIGAVHLSIAHFWNALILYPSLKSIAQIGWIALVWTMYFTACNMVLQDAFPPWVLFTFTGGLIAITLFMTSASEFKSEWIQHAMLPLSVVSCFVDVVSYVRLFAVGMASLSVAQSFNDMALSLGLSRVWTVPLAALILLVGHGLNILLCALGVLVHGVRLNTLEFSLHKNMEWSGVPYLPFCKNMQGEET